MGNLLINLIKYSNTNCKENLGKDCKESWVIFTINLVIDPFLKLEDEQHDHKDNKQTEKDHWKSDKITK